MITIEDLRNNPQNEQEKVIESEKGREQPPREQPQSVSLRTLYRFASGRDCCLILIGIVFSLVSGCCLPCFAYLWGKVLDMFLLTNDIQERISIAIHYRNIFFYVGLGALASSWISFASWTVLSERMAVRCRKAYMKSLLRQDVGWFDTQNQFQLSSNFNADALAYQKATGEKINSMLYLLAMFICGLIIAIFVGWKMALVISPNLLVVGGVMILFIYIKHKKKEAFLSYSEQADSRSHQALSTIKTVKALNGQQFEEATYISYLQLLKQQVPKWSLYDGIGTGLFFSIQYCAFSFSYWYGTHCVGNTQKCQSGVAYTPGEATIVFFAISIGCYNFMPLLPNLSAIIEGMKAAGRLYAIIDKEPTIDMTNNHDRPGIEGVQITGHLVFDRVTFAYPKNKDHKVLSKISLQAKPGSKIALVGDSGSGKSTVVQLLMRFYDPDQGRVTLDGFDIKDYNLHWLRSQIGYVGQEPSLFEGTILDNVRIGKSDATVEEVTDALRAAEALEFVNSLPDQLSYNVGYAGSHLSGGQKQRIAIARALVRKPKVLILDEATSALDRRNEKLIQNTLQKISQGITTLIVAHRVKTVMNADQIYVIRSGAVVQSGRFRQLERFRSLDINVDEELIDFNSYSDKNQAQVINEAERRLGELYQTSTQADQQQEYRGSVFSRLFQYTEGNRSQLFTAVICAIISGAVHPVGALLLANILYRQFKMYPISKVLPGDPNVSTLISEAEDYALWLFLLSIFIFFCFSIQSVLFTRVGQAITETVRKDVYRKLLRLPVQWFHIKKNRGGAAATRFSADSRQVNSLLSSLLSTLLMNFSQIAVGMVLAFVFEWRLGIIGIVAIPCMVAAGFISMLFVGGFGDKSKKHYEKSAKLSEEAILNIRTVYSCGYQESLGKTYDRQLQQPLDESLWTGSWLGILYGSSQLILQFTFGCLFYFNSLIMRDHPEVSLLDIFYSNMVIIWAGWYAGNNFYFMPDVVRSRQAASSLFEILEEEDEIQMQDKSASKKLTTPIHGNLSVNNLSFKYNPHDENVINNISFNIRKGQKIAFVGPSGSGKSTFFQLLQRFYDFSGQILIDGIEIRDYDIHHVRAHFVAVSQEPSLFTGTIGSNIRYNFEADEAQLTQAAKNAQALSFINSKQKRFESEVGVMGMSLSGGQKQRVAIARGLIRNPQILILDEATSALDLQTEKKVQANVDAMMIEKTSLVIAHRIETIVNSDRIYVFDKGQILEQGSYKELSQLKRHFYNLERGEKLKQQ